MSSIGSITNTYPALPLDRPEPLTLPGSTGETGAASPSQGFGSMLDGLVSMVDEKDAQANALNNSVLLGNSDQLHQSVIAMQEASVALSLMVQVRNKLVDSYQELMRMQV